VVSIVNSNWELDMFSQSNGYESTVHIRFGHLGCIVSYFGYIALHRFILGYIIKYVLFIGLGNDN
jgi:hypothetical protein